MPLIRKKQDGDTQTGVWRMTEALTELESRYEIQPAERATYSGFRNDRRRKEWLTVRILLEELLGKGVHISYQPSGKPFLVGSNLFISITHTIGYVGIRLGVQPVALDMEYKSRRVINLIPHFVSPRETQYIDPADEVTTALIIWSAKETLYKRFDFTDVLFDEHLSVRSLVVNGPEGVFTGCVSKDGFYAEVELHYKLSEDLIIVYC